MATNCQSNPNAANDAKTQASRSMAKNHCDAGLTSFDVEEVWVKTGAIANEFFVSQFNQ